MYVIAITFIWKNYYIFKKAIYESITMPVKLQFLMLSYKAETHRNYERGHLVLLVYAMWNVGNYVYVILF